MTLKPPTPLSSGMYFSPAGFGGIGNGDADDTAAIAAARATAVAMGGVTFFGGGHWTHTGGLEINGNEHWAGTHYKNSVLEFSLSTPGPAITPVDPTVFTDHVKIEHLGILGDSVNTTIGLDMRSCRDWTVRDVELNNFTDTPCNVYGQRGLDGSLAPGDSTFNEFDHVRFLGGVDACRLTGTAGTARGDGGVANMNTLIACRFANATRRGLWIDQGASNAVIRCTAVANDEDGIRVGWYGNFIGDGITVENNGGWGLHFAADALCKDNNFWGIHDGGSNVLGVVSDEQHDNTGHAGRRGIQLGRNLVGTGAIDVDTIYNSADGILRWKDKDATVGIVRTRKGSIPNIASAATITLDPAARVQKITGATTVTSIDVTGNTERVVTLVSTSTAQLTDGGNLKLASNFTGGADRSITLVCDGTNWFETGRSVN